MLHEQNEDPKDQRIEIDVYEATVSDSDSKEQMTKEILGQTISLKSNQSKYQMSILYLTMSFLFKLQIRRLT